MATFVKDYLDMRNNKYALKIFAKIIYLFLFISVFLLTGCESGTKKVERKVLDFADKKCAHIEGSSIAKSVKEAYPNFCDLIEYPSIVDCVIALQNKKIDCFLYDYPIIRLLDSKNPELCLLPDKVCEDIYGLVLPKNSPLTKDVQRAVDELKQEGALKDLEEIWFGSDISRKVMPKQDWPGKNGTLRCAIHENQEPMSYMDSHFKTLGYDANLVYLVAKKLDKKVVFISVDVVGRITFVAEGKADIGCGSISITKDRQKVVDFVPYYNSSIVALIRKDDLYK